MNGCADCFPQPQTLAPVWFSCQTDAVDQKRQDAGKDPQEGGILRKLANCVTFDRIVLVPNINCLWVFTGGYGLIIGLKEKQLD